MASPVMQRKTPPILAGDFSPQFTLDLFNKDFTRCTLDDPRAVEALQLMQDLVHKYRVAPTPDGPTISAAPRAASASRTGRRASGRSATRPAARWPGSVSTP